MRQLWRGWATRLAGAVLILVVGAPAAAMADPGPAAPVFAPWGLAIATGSALPGSGGEAGPAGRGSDTVSGGGAIGELRIGTGSAAGGSGSGSTAGSGSDTGSSSDTGSGIGSADPAAGTLLRLDPDPERPRPSAVHIDPPPAESVAAPDRHGAGLPLEPWHDDAGSGPAVLFCLGSAVAGSAGGILALLTGSAGGSAHIGSGSGLVLGSGIGSAGVGLLGTGSGTGSAGLGSAAVGSAASGSALLLCPPLPTRPAVPAPLAVPILPLPLPAPVPTAPGAVLRAAPVRAPTAPGPVLPVLLPEVPRPVAVEDSPVPETPADPVAWNVLELVTLLVVAVFAVRGGPPSVGRAPISRP